MYLRDTKIWQILLYSILLNTINIIYKLQEYYMNVY